MSALLSGCSPSNSGTGNGGNTVLSTITDPKWSAGNDIMIAISAPQNDSDHAIFALAQFASNARLLQAKPGDSTFSTSDFTSFERFEDMVAFRIDDTQGGVTKTDYLIAACAYNASSSSATIRLFLASDPETTRTTTSLWQCNGLSPRFDSGDDSNVARLYLVGRNNTSPAIGNSKITVDLFTTSASSRFVTSSNVAGFNQSRAMKSVTTAYEENGDPFAILASTTNTNTIIERATGASARTTLFDSATNPLTGAQSIFSVAAMTRVEGQGVYLVSGDQGMIGLAESALSSGGTPTKISAAAASRCADALDYDGDNLWCHDATSEGRIISFSPPAIP
ncbi:hypothetical protein [Saccharospirillum mangrovi]|uniref:hypothetical protein n=1 Tax=Saccharospirillum mangrovi TaxID=2161747 RepID=UPI00130096DA|nr:hypothetical protein [Saccharospirillum mangrovi]